MANDPRGGDLFIVDNGVSGWTAFRYLEEWADYASAFDIATGYFEIGSLTSLDGKWQKLDKVRILMGAEMTDRTRKAMLDAVRLRAETELDCSLEVVKTTNPFLDRVPAIVEAMRSGKIECRVYDKKKFHAKAYITHAKAAVVSSNALVGSSNFTIPGLTHNIELNIRVESSAEVRQLQEWFEAHWTDASDVTDAVITTIERHVRLYSPFDVYARALQEYFRGHELTATEWDETKSRMFPRLDRYQKEAYWALMKIAQKFGGAFLCDGVGLGKTFVGLMLIERLVMQEGKRVVLFAPKATKEGVWDPHLREWLPDVGGSGSHADFSNLAVFSHTDLGRTGDYPARFKRIAEMADVVVIDEAHHFRNPGRQGDAESGREPSRYHLLYDLLDFSRRPKTLYLLTATPINNQLSDLRHMIELFTRRDETHFARTLGINSLRAHFNQMEKSLRKRVGYDVTDVGEHAAETREVLADDEIFRGLVVQRSRAYARESQIRETSAAASFPVREAPKVAAYSIRKTYGDLLGMLDTAFRKKDPLFSLPMYYPLHWYRGPDKSIDPFEEGRQSQIVGLIRTQFLKRFESSVAAFEMSCERLLRKLLAFAEVNSETDAERKRLERWKTQNAEDLSVAAQRYDALWGRDDDGADEEDIVPQEMLDDAVRLDRTLYDVPEMLSETSLDLDQILKFLVEVRSFNPAHDDKLQRLIALLRSPELAGQKVLIFTEFADTARYLKRQLDLAEIDGVEQVDGSTKGNRAHTIQRFAPYYNGTSSAQLAGHGRHEIRILISTDVLSEGLNLQDASRMINYDIHWNPVRLMQRIGRVDRRMNPEIEERLKADHPEVVSSRGTVHFWNFLPPDELNAILSLYQLVTRKTLLISKTMGIEGQKLLTPEDDYAALQEFNSAYEGTRTAIEDMNLEYQALLAEHPGLEDRLRRLPGGTFSGRARVNDGVRGVFFSYALPALDMTVEPPAFTEAAGTTRWYLYDLDRNTILEDAGEIVASIRSVPDTPRRCTMDPPRLIELRDAIEKHIKNTYLKRVDAPLGVKPALKCWMELNED